MKKLITLLACALFTLNTFSQKVQPNYSTLGSYSGGGGGTTGAFVNYRYDTFATPSNDTIRYTARMTFNKAVVYVSHNLVILFDTTGDTAAYYNVQHNIAGPSKVWIKKNPFLLNHQLDQFSFYFINTSTSSNYQVKLPWCVGGLAGDTVHVPKKTTSPYGGGAFLEANYLYQGNQLEAKPYTTW